MGHGILAYFTRHGTAANLLLALLVILGIAAFPNMRAQFFPDVIVSRVTVSVGWEGAVPFTRINALPGRPKLSNVPLVDIAPRAFGFRGLVPKSVKIQL